MGVGPQAPAIVGAFIEGGTPAETAGFEIGDVIKKVDGQVVHSYMHFGKFVRGSEGQESTREVEVLAGETVRVTIDVP